MKAAGSTVPALHDWLANFDSAGLEAGEDEALHHEG
jgi:hypothetical protein